MSYTRASGLRKETVKLLLKELEALQQRYHIEVADYNRFRALLKSQLMKIENTWIRFAIVNFEKPWQKRLNGEGEQPETYMSKRE